MALQTHQKRIGFVEAPFAWQCPEKDDAKMTIAFCKGKSLLKIRKSSQRKRKHPSMGNIFCWDIWHEDNHPIGYRMSCRLRWFSREQDGQPNHPDFTPCLLEDLKNDLLDFTLEPPTCLEIWNYQKLNIVPKSTQECDPRFFIVGCLVPNLTYKIIIHPFLKL